jgi:peptidoglycan/xylan/chitin deacetylase (PgdA/CDA1 family)
MTRPAAPLTVVMYHYVRPIAGSRYPGIKGLELAAFEGQLDYLQRHHAFVTARDVVEAARASVPLPANPVLLTFDDGYADHREHVLPALVRRGIGGAFFPPACTAIDRRMLDVNRVHFVLAAADPAAVVRIIESRVEERRAEFDLAPVETYRAEYAHASRFDTAPVSYIKRMLQRALPQPLRHAIADELFRRFVTADERSFVDELYLDVDDLREMRDAGMEIGSHGDSHQWLDSLSGDEQRVDIEHSLRLLDAVDVPRLDFLFCYPYGSYDADTLRVLAALGCAAAFTTTVGLAKASAATLLQLPRLDTNDLPTDAAAAPCGWTLTARASDREAPGNKELA